MTFYGNSRVEFIKTQQILSLSYFPSCYSTHIIHSAFAGDLVAAVSQPATTEPHLIGGRIPARGAGLRPEGSLGLSAKRAQLDQRVV